MFDLLRRNLQNFVRPRQAGLTKQRKLESRWWDMNRSYFVCSGRLQHLLKPIDCHLCHSLLPFLPFGAVNAVLLPVENATDPLSLSLSLFYDALFVF